MGKDYFLTKLYFYSAPLAVMAVFLRPSWAKIAAEKCTKPPKNTVTYFPANSREIWYVRGSTLGQEYWM